MHATWTVGRYLYSELWCTTRDPSIIRVGGDADKISRTAGSDWPTAVDLLGKSVVDDGSRFGSVNISHEYGVRPCLRIYYIR